LARKSEDGPLPHCKTEVEPEDNNQSGPLVDDRPIMYELSSHYLATISEMTVLLGVKTGLSHYGKNRN
jgi:hypothetical protein